MLGAEHGVMTAQARVPRGGSGLIRRYPSTPVTTEPNEHAEGPVWDPRTGQLLWIDQYAGLVMLGDFDPGLPRVTPVRTYRLGHAVGAAVPSRAFGGGWLTATAQGFAHLAEDGTVTMLAQPEEQTPVRTRMNDGKCDALGRFWAGSMAWDKADGAGSLYRLDPDLTVTVVLRDVTISNGLAWSADGGQLFYIDTPTQQVDRFRVGDDATLHDRTTVIRIAEGTGFPDGMCIDDDGCLWVALWGGSAVHRYAPDGELLAIVDVGAAQVSSCCFGGPDGSTLFITTSQEGYDADQLAADPQAGKLFCAAVDASAPPAAAFGTASS
jgi:sugar lactone lactonase YvrE